MAAPIVTCPNCGRRNRVAPAPEGVPRCAACHTVLPWLVDADAGSFDAEVTASVPVVVDFWAQWCGPCKWVEPAVQQLARDHAGRLKIVRVDIDAAPDPAARFGVQSIPTLVLLQDANEIDRITGAAPKHQLDAWLGRHVGARAPT